MISHLLLKSTLSRSEFASYDLEQIRYKNTVYNGVKSKDFVKDDWQIITLERLIKNFFDESLYRAIYRITDYEERLRFLVSQVERVTGLKGFGYPLVGDVADYLREAKAKTFCDSFDDQLDISEKLYGGHLKFSFTKKDVKELLDAASIYPAEVRKRVGDVIYMQMEKYGYLFGK